MTDSIDIPAQSRRPRRMRHQEYPGAEAHSPSQPVASSSASKTKSPLAARSDMAVLAGFEDDAVVSSTPSSLGAPSSANGSPALPTAMRLAEGRSKDKGKGRAVDAPAVTAPAQTERRNSQPLQSRRTSLMGESISRTEHTVIDVGDPDGTPRLITCVKTGQGFAWNPELLLPSYLCERNSDLERRQDPVQDIILTEEEMECMFPQ